METPETKVSDECFYVYLHKDIHNNVVYVGMGQNERCLSTARRSADHSKFIRHAIASRGLDFVSLEAKSLERNEALRMERSLISKYLPVYNKMGISAANAGRGSKNHNSVFSSEEVSKYRDLWDRWEGSMRAFHRKHLSDYQWTTVYKLLSGLSHKEV